MKRLASLALVMLLCFSVCVPVFAMSGADSLESHTVFETDGSCLVTLTLVAELVGNEGYVEFPLPDHAVVQSEEEYPVRTDGDQTYLRLPVTGSGRQTMTLCYRLEDATVREWGQTYLVLPILGGFQFTIRSMEFSVELPGSFPEDVQLESGYHHQNVDQILKYSINGHVLSGHTTAPIKDHETLTLRFLLPDGMFYDAPWQMPALNGWDLAMLLLVVVSVAYFLLILLPNSVERIRTCTPPVGITAGDVGTCLTGCGTDLTMMVLTWAQLGYIAIELDRRGNVTLHKRMEMGNERSAYEARWFKNIFGQHTSVDADSYHYARLCRKLAARSPMRAQLYRRRAGSRLVLRVLCTVVGLVAGMYLGIGLGINAASRTLLGILFSLICGIFSWLIQSGGKCLPLREKRPLWVAIAAAVAWILLSLLTGHAHQAMPLVLFQFGTGVAAAYGGKRSELGARLLSQVRGLRRHMLLASAYDLQQTLKNNPEYFFEMAPYALALGVDRNFARRFGKTPLPESSCFVGEQAREMTAVAYAARLRRVADVLNRRQKQLPYEKLKR